MIGGTKGLFIPTALQHMNIELRCYDSYNVTRWYEFFQFHYNLLGSPPHMWSIFWPTRHYVIHDTTLKTDHHVPLLRCAQGHTVSKW